VNEPFERVVVPVKFYAPDVYKSVLSRLVMAEIYEIPLSHGLA